MDDIFMRVALDEAHKAAQLGEIPVGAVIVQHNKIIAQTHNLRETTKDSTSHAEVLAIRQASAQLGGWRLIDCTLYVTLEPCPMCAGAAINARLPRIVFGAYDFKSGALGSVFDLNSGKLNHTANVTGGFMEEECAKIMKDFFAARRRSAATRWKTK